MAETVTPGTFIPHDAATPRATRTRGGGGLNELLLLCAIVLVVASGALAVGVFLYGQLLQSQTSSKVAQLQRAEAAFEPSLIEQITQLDDRMSAGSAILSGHLAPTAFFAALEQSTLQSISFQNLDLEAPDPQHITVKMQGVAESVNSIALQAQLFSQSGVITSPIFSNIARQPDGVHFDFSASVNPTALSYTSLITAAVSQGSTQSSAQNTAGQNANASATASSTSGGSPFGVPTQTQGSGTGSNTTQ